MKILIISPTFPCPPNSGPTIRIYNSVKYLSKENEIHLVSFEDRKIGQDELREVKKWCSNVILVKMRKRPKLLQLHQVVYRFAKGLPFTLKYSESDALRKVLKKISLEENYDIIQWEHSYMAHHVQCLSTEVTAKRILSFHNVACAQYYRIFRAEKRLIRKIRHFCEWYPMFAWEPKMAEKFDKSLVVSEMDKQLLKYLNPVLDVSIVPNGIDTKSFVSYPISGRGNELLFVGAMDYEPNIDAVLYFCQEIFPMIQRKMPGIKLRIVGRNSPRNVQKLAANRDVVICGHVEDVMPFYSKAMLAVVPLRCGGGTRLKILEAMATGTPVISTSVGCEGLDVKAGENIMIADSPEDFAGKAVALLSERELWTKIARDGRKLVEERYDWEKIMWTMQDIYRDLVKE